MRTCLTPWRAARRGGLCTSQTQAATARRAVVPSPRIEPPRPSAWGRYLAPALDRLDGYFVAGLPIVTAFPGLVYGNASWFRERVIEPVHGGPSCAAVWEDRTVGIAHSRPRLCPRVGASRRARRTWRPLFPREQSIRSGCRSSRVRSPVSPTVRCAYGGCPWPQPDSSPDPVLADDILGRCRCSRTSACAASAFASEYPTLEQGLQQILGALHE